MKSTHRHRPTLVALAIVSLLQIGIDRSLADSFFGVPDDAIVVDDEAAFQTAMFTIAGTGQATSLLVTEKIQLTAGYLPSPHDEQTFGIHHLPANCAVYIVNGGGFEIVDENVTWQILDPVYAGNYQVFFNSKPSGARQSGTEFPASFYGTFGGVTRWSTWWTGPYIQQATVAAMPDLTEPIQSAMDSTFIGGDFIGIKEIGNTDRAYGARFRFPSGAFKVTSPLWINTHQLHIEGVSGRNSTIVFSGEGDGISAGFELAGSAPRNRIENLRCHYAPEGSSTEFVLFDVVPAAGKQGGAYLEPTEINHIYASGPMKGFFRARHSEGADSVLHLHFHHLEVLPEIAPGFIAFDLDPKWVCQLTVEHSTFRAGGDGQYDGTIYINIPPTETSSPRLRYYIKSVNNHIETFETVYRVHRRAQLVVEHDSIGFGNDVPGRTVLDLDHENSAAAIIDVKLAVKTNGLTAPFLVLDDPEHFNEATELIGTDTQGANDGIIANQGGVRPPLLPLRVSDPHGGIPPVGPRPLACVSPCGG